MKGNYIYISFLLVCILLLTSCNSLSSLTDWSSTSSPSAGLNFTQVSQGLARNLILPNQKICLGNFTVSASHQQPLAMSLQQDLEFEMAKYMQVLERRRLQEILEQHRIENSNFFNQDNINRIGQFAQVDYILLGEIQERTSDYEILGKIIDVKTAIIVKASKAFLSKNQVPAHLIQQMARHELLERGYPTKQEAAPEAMSYFTQSYLSSSSPQQNLQQPLQLQMLALKKVAGQISPLSNGDSLKPQDQYQIQIRLNKPAYLYSLAVHSDGNPSSIFPNTFPHTPQNPLQSEQTYHLPGPDAEGWFVVTDQKGLGQIGVLLSMQPIPDLEQKILQLPSQNTPTKNNVKTSPLLEKGLTIKDPIFPTLEGVARQSKRLAAQIQQKQQGQFTCYRDMVLLPVWFQTTDDSEADVCP